MSKKRLVYLVLLILIIVLSFLYSKTSGLVAYFDNNKIVHYVKEYKSSGSNDDIVVEIGVGLFIFPLIIGIFRRKKKFSILEYFTFSIICLIQFTFVIFFIEIGDIVLTIKNGNIILLLWMLVILVLCIFSFLLFWYNLKIDKKNNNNIQKG